jgi:hypothetical protein
MAYSLQPTVQWTLITGAAAAGGRYAADLVLQLPARGAGSVALHSAFIDSTEHLVDAIALGYEVIVLRYKSNQASALSQVHLASITARRYSAAQTR